jgi:zinc transporter ZupT
MGQGLAAGVMTYITVDELIPFALEYSTVIHKHYISTGLLADMIFSQVLSVILNV